MSQKPLLKSRLFKLPQHRRFNFPARYYDEDKERLDIWCSVADDNAKYGKYSVAGAKAGRKFGSENAEDPEKLGLINDYDWLTGQFRKEFDNE